MPDVNVNIEASPVVIKVAAAESSVSILNPVINTTEVEASPIAVTVSSAPVSVIVSGTKGADGTSNVSNLWISLINSWTEPPTINATLPVIGGLVYDYTYGSTIRYRHIPDPYVSTSDSFYSSYSSGVLSGLVAAKGLPIS